DASGTTPPQVIYETVKEARRRLGEDIHLRVHSHETAGISIAQYRAALDAGADGIDLSMAPMSGGTAQPDVVTMWQALRGTDFDLGVDIDKVLAAEEVFKECMKDYFLPPESRAVEPLIPFSPMPGGALTANTQMMRDNGMLDKYPAAIREMREVVSLGGFGSSVTPVSQFYFQQALNNAIFGRWQRIAEGYGKMVLGYFGKTPREPDPKVVALAAEQLGLEPTTRDPRLINDEDPTKGRDAAAARLDEAGLPHTEENIFIAASLKEKGIAFLQGRGDVAVRKNGPEKATARGPTGPKPSSFRVHVGGRAFDVEVRDGRAVINGRTLDYRVEAGPGGDTQAAPAASAAEPVNAQMPGKILKHLVSVGQQVAEGDALLLIEAMKMEMEVAAPRAGRVAAIPADEGQQVAAGEPLVLLS
ncbi:MAG: biotin/lipoyl-containing protein, partial [Myxococcota bacterium]|nr:biotin/lipoyl-containing protein [Myxococcota bacterium]